MNQIVLMGRLARDTETRYTQGENSICVTRYTLAVDRRGKDTGADFFRVVTFGKAAEFAEKYFKKGMRVLVSGHVQTGSYTNRDGVKIPTFDIVADNQEFADSKAEKAEAKAEKTEAKEDGFMYVPEGADEGLPFV